MIAGKTWREVRTMTAVYLLILELMLVPAILLWPDLYADLQRSGFLRRVPVTWLRHIGEGIADRDQDLAYLHWLALQLFFKGVNLAGLACAVLLGTSLFAREREASTLEFLLARPVARGKILWQKAWPTALASIVPVFLANWSAIWWSHTIEQPVPFWPLTLCCLHSALFVLFFLAWTTLASVLCRVQAHVAFWVGGLSILQMGVYLIPTLRQTSIFRLSDYDWYAPILVGTRGLQEMFDPFGGPGLSTWLLAGTALAYGLALAALRRLEP